MNCLRNYLLISIISLLFMWVNKVFLLSENVYFNSLTDQLTYEQIEDFIAQGEKWEWIGYVLTPAIYLVKFSLIALVLSIGLWFTTNHFEFKQLFGAAVVAEFVFLLPVLLKIGWFLFVQTNYSLQDLQFFYPLSALNLFEREALEPWLVYPLQLLNVFEVVYWVVLAYQVAPFVIVRGAVQQQEESFFDRAGRGLGVVLQSYGTGLIIWMALVMFLTITYT